VIRIAECAADRSKPTRGVSWSGEEHRVLGRYVRAYLRGEYKSGNQAARDCLRELSRRFTADPGSSEFPRRRGFYGVYAVLLQRSLQQGRLPTRRRWSPEEQRILDSYVRAIARGRYRDAQEATRAFLEDRPHLRRRYPKAQWLRVARNYYGTYRVMLKLARNLVRPRVKRELSTEEQRLIDRYARLYIRGEIPSVGKAAREFLRECERRRRRYPKLAHLFAARTLKGVGSRIRSRIRDLGLPARTVRWSPAEDRVLDRYVRALMAGRYRHAREAARDCMVDMEKLYRKHPAAIWARTRRKWRTLAERLGEQVHVLGRLWRFARFTPEEKRFLDRYARALVGGRYRTARDAGQECWRAMKRAYDRRSARQHELPGVRFPRSVRSVVSLLAQRSAALGRELRNRIWRPAELAVVREGENRDNYRLFGRKLGTLPWFSASQAQGGLADRRIRGSLPRSGLQQRRTRTVVRGASEKCGMRSEEPNTKNTKRIADVRLQSAEFKVKMRPG